MTGKKLIALAVNIIVFAAMEVFVCFLNDGWTDLFLMTFIDPIIFGVTWGIFENIGCPVLSGKNGVSKIIFPIIRMGLIQILLFSLPLMKSFFSGRFDLTDIFNTTLLIAVLIGYVSFFITCAVAVCPPNFIRKENNI